MRSEKGGGWVPVHAHIRVQPHDHLGLSGDLLRCGADTCTVEDIYSQCADEVVEAREAVQVLGEERVGDAVPITRPYRLAFPGCWGPSQQGCDGGGEEGEEACACGGWDEGVDEYDLIREQDFCPCLVLVV